jgi:hypothetical protein
VRGPPRDQSAQFRGQDQGVTEGSSQWSGSGCLVRGPPRDQSAQFRGQEQVVY